MISRQRIDQRRKQRRHPPDQLTIPMEQERSRQLRYEHSLALWALREPIGRAIRTLQCEAYEITDEHCDTIVVAFHALQVAVRNCISILNGPDLTAEMRPYPVIMKLSSQHRILIDAQVLVENVRGQCRCGRLVTDPSGSYWHLRTYMFDVLREYQSLLGLLKQEVTVSQSSLA